MLTPCDLHTVCAAHEPGGEKKQDWQVNLHSESINSSMTRLKANLLLALPPCCKCRPQPDLMTPRLNMMNKH